MSREAVDDSTSERRSSQAESAVLGADPGPARRVAVPLGERSYDVLIRSGSLEGIGDRLRALGLSGKAGIVTNPIVGRLYARRITRALARAGFKPQTIVVPDGERTKSLRWITTILDTLVRSTFDRGAVLIALGGGVIGDLTGFAAAVYLRGIPFVQVPTTLVAQVDSSVGGKTGINHSLGKNQIGAFYQPRLVLVDPDTLSTLPKREWTAGLAEVIKYGVIADAEFFRFLENSMSQLVKKEERAVVHAIARACEIKASVVAQDERESGLRRILNYGHTVGHALESLGRYRSCIHGEAVAIGMVQEADLARYLGLCGGDVVDRQHALIQTAGLPTAMPRVRFTELWGALQHDKKIARGKLHCVFPCRIGEVTVVPLERNTCKAWFSQRSRDTASY